MTRCRLLGLWTLALFTLTLASCGGGGGGSTGNPIPATFVLTVNSTTPASGIAIGVSPADRTGATAGNTSFTRTYAAGTSITLTAPATSSTGTFKSWSGCTSTSTVTCIITLNANATVTAAYVSNAVNAVQVTPSPAPVIIGTTQQFTATVTGASVTDSSVTWSLVGPPGSALSNGTITSGGLYTSPYPAPASITVVATSNQDPSVSGSATVTLSPPATVAGPGLVVDAGDITHAISPLIYGMNSYQLDASVGKAVRLPVDRWGGDSATSYNYLLDVDNTAGDYYFENFPGTSTNYPIDSEFNTQVTADAANATKTLGTVPLIGWTPKRSTACSFSVSKYGAQQAVDPNRPDCGNGVLLNGSQVVNDPTDAYSSIDDTFTAGWVKFLAGQFGAAANGGVAIYDLDNEPEYWDSVHVDIHPKPFNYDELTTKAIAYAKAIKANDASAEVSGPVISDWMDFFYSRQDIETGWASAPCYCANGNPTDRIAHGDIPLIEYYLQQFKKYEDTNGARLLDYVDLHTYFAANDLAFSTAGDTTTQQARLNSTRVFWDPTYTDPTYTDPNNRTSSAAPYPPQLIPLMKNWIGADYPGTKAAITEYNWGGQESINGALAQADILGIFGREGLDLGTLWGAPNPQTQVPGELAFEIYRNYDGVGTAFGDMALSSVSEDQSKLSVYGALRSADSNITIVVINKTYGDLSGILSIPNYQPASEVSAKAYLYSSSNLAAILAQPNVAIAPVVAGSTTLGITTTFPAHSISLFVVPAP